MICFFLNKNLYFPLFKDVEKKFKNKVLGCCTDAASSMVKAAECLQEEMGYTKMLHLTCVLHGTHRTCVTIRKTFPKLDKFMTATRNLFSNSTARKRLFASVCPGLKIPPAPSGTRFGVWIECVDYYTDENLIKLSEFIESIKVGLMTQTELASYKEGKLNIPINLNEEEDFEVDLDSDDFENENVAEAFETEQITRKRKPNSRKSNEIGNAQLEATPTEAPPKKKMKKSASSVQRHRKIRFLSNLQLLCSDKEISSQAKYVRDNFSFIPLILKKLQYDNLDAVKAIGYIEKIDRKLHKIHDIQPAIINHFDNIFKKKNVGYQLIKNFHLNGIAEGPLANLNEEEQTKMNRAALTSAAPERVFSVHKAFYRDNRRNFKFENVKMFVTCKCILNRVSM